MTFERSISLVLLIFLSKIVFAQSSTTVYGDNAAAGKYADIRGFKMYYETYGTGEPLLLIHPNGGTIKSFENQIDFFAKNYKVVVADSRAQGKSIDATDSLSYEMMADDYNALLDYLKLKQAYVIGWSDGAINALLLAMRHPDKVRKIAATGANLRPDTTALHPYVYNDILTTDRQMRDSIKTGKASAKLKNAYKVNHMMLVHPNIKPAQLHVITAPTLIIGGDHEAIPAKHTVEIAEALPNAYLWIIPASGHSTPVYQKDWFNALISNFFSHPFQRIEGKRMYY
ncbi:alpha/beta fold hydrolase [Mucilaginibacter auburnensis]|uniref:Pimeloyl-ACP methyl ester carboxylesterase n=1 Tax=Mucilaginibacter auburnensis TaxID=1457233 RepID=A0A2H9VQ37_9SPHI|nr:alpha/beta hydrolase [Mucilaginibacter auburnensis]PJJ80432.1 pimeloyl-ACP methyl ester carboxylesterase [Mucilaginibacter auburnensis]